MRRREFITLCGAAAQESAERLEFLLQFRLIDNCAHALAHLQHDLVRRFGWSH